MLVAASAEEREAEYRHVMNGGSIDRIDESETENQADAAAADDSERGRNKRQKRQGWQSVAK